MHWAAEAGNKTLVERLLTLAFSSNVSASGLTPLLITVHRASEYCHFESKSRQSDLKEYRQKWWDTAEILRRNQVTPVSAKGFRYDPGLQTATGPGTPNEAILAALTIENWEALNFAKPSDERDRGGTVRSSRSKASMIASRCTPADVLVAVRNWKEFVLREQVAHGVAASEKPAEVSPYEFSGRIFVVGQEGALADRNGGRFPTLEGEPVFAHHKKANCTIVFLIEQILSGGFRNDSIASNFCVLRTAQNLFKCIAWEHDLSSLGAEW
jgi:hypothetical protein